MVPVSVNQTVDYEDHNQEGPILLNDGRRMESSLPEEQKSECAESALQRPAKASQKQVEQSQPHCPGKPRHQKRKGSAEKPSMAKDIKELLSHIWKKENMKVTVTYSVLGGLAVGATALAGFMLGGPLGFAAGGTFGGALGALITREKFKPFPKIFLELSPAEQQELIDKAAAIIRNLKWKHVRQLIALVSSNQDIWQKILALLKTYFK